MFMISMLRVPRTLLRDCSLHRVVASACCGLLLGSLAWTPVARAQAWVPGKGQGAVSLILHQSETTKLTDSHGHADHFGKVIGRTLFLNIDYGLSDRWAISASLPFKSNRYTGQDPHNPQTLPFPNDQRFVDDGQFHDGWADWSVALRYQWRTEPFLITPFIVYSRPSHPYTFFAHSAFGNQQWALTAGVHVGGWLSPPLQNLYWQAGYAYSFEQPLDHRHVNRGVVSLEAGYFLTPRLEAHLGVEHENSYGDTINLPQDFFNADGSLNPGNLYYHDQLAASRYTNATMGLDYQLNDRYQLSLHYARTLNSANAHIYDYVASFGISRSF